MLLKTHESSPLEKHNFQSVLSDLRAADSVKDLSQFPRACLCATLHAFDRVREERSPRRSRIEPRGHAPSRAPFDSLNPNVGNNRHWPNAVHFKETSRIALMIGIGVESESVSKSLL
jgi:hypothetical protein